jgi:hypothetical protein
MPTIELTPEVLRALAEGIDRLNDGDTSDRAVVEAVETQVLDQAGLVCKHGLWVAREEATGGYIKQDGEARYVWKDYEGFWVTSEDTVPLGVDVYLDADCKHLVCKTG